ncbi:MAG: ribonuclease D [Chloroflexota bacterium]|jgi:ribonuclease D
MKSVRTEQVTNASNPPTLPPYQFIADERSWNTCLEALRSAPRLAIDLEANSMYAYRERVCLIQISITAADYIIDPVPGFDLSGLGILLDDPAVEKVFHAAEYDLILMKRDYSWELNNLFDTMWAARILGYSQIGLANLIDQFFDVRLSKRYQKANWCHRPLKAAELSYAQRDTHYLLDLRDRLGLELEQHNRATEAREIFEEQSRVRLPNNGFDPQGFWNLNGVYELNPTQQTALQALYLFRDQEARRRDAPHFKILNDRTLLELATRLPGRLDDLLSIHGMSPGQRDRYGRRLLDVIAKSRQDTLSPPPKRAPRPADEVLVRYDKVHQWRKKQAQARGVESDVIVSRDALWAIATHNPQNEDELAKLGVLGPWRFKTYAREILRLFQ